MSEPARTRSFFRRYPGLTISSAIFLALVGYFLYELTRAITAKPGAAGLYAKDIEAAVRTSQKNLPGQDAWGQFLLAMNALDAGQRSYASRIGRPSTGGAYPDPPVDWPDGVDWPVDPSAVGTEKSSPRTEAYVRDLLTQLRADGSLAELAKLVPPAPAVRPIPPTKMLELLLPELGKSRQVARLNRARMVLALDAGDTAEFLAAFEQSLALARVVGNQGTLIDHLVGLAITAMTLDHLRYQIADNRLDAPTLRSALAAIDRQLPFTGMSVALDTERYMALDTIEWTHSTEGRAMVGSSMSIANGSGDARPVSLGGVENIVSIVLPSKKQSQDAVEQFHTLVRKQAELPFYARARPSPAETFAEGLSRRYVVVKLLIPAVDRALTTESAVHDAIAGTRIMIALQLHRLDKGAYPAALQDLVPAYLPALPPDEFNAAGITYKLRDAASADPVAAYVLYSFGADLADNGGAVPPDGILNANTSGSDLLYNTHRPRAK